MNCPAEIQSDNTVAGHSPVADVAESGGYARQQSRIPVTDRADHGTQTDATRHRREHREKRPAVEEWFLHGAVRREMVEVIRHPERVEAILLCALDVDFGILPDVPSAVWIDK